MEYIAVLGQYIHIALGLQYITYHHGMEYIVLAVPLIRPRSGIQVIVNSRSLRRYGIYTEVVNYAVRGRSPRMA